MTIITNNIYCGNNLKVQPFDYISVRNIKIIRALWKRRIETPSDFVSPTEALSFSYVVIAKSYINKQYIQNKLGTIS